MQYGRSPHGLLHIVYVNMEGCIKGAQDLTCTPLVKEDYTADKRLADLTIMCKLKGCNPEYGDWFWAKYASGGTVQKEGKPEGYIACHMGRVGHDFIMTSDC
ncbi:conserved protein of unknown function [Pseudodesulfovibrio piezophilus C1TLV30]|uniref:Uncharacterized protein n=1 Tax=Pseudodesulfovibrio piezophilus (strain DSM 21447 / JCM 15486 / C1TLV30) TaxID=1322246 RepID=M1WW29_PSEP2|nr:conserved protein of unknown function [Pseudodesulfovibrio piezophilus C1TLV30]